jgi:hypothetical protein
MAWLTESGGGQALGCAVCGSADWFVGEHAVQLVRWASTAFVEGGISYPMLMLGCNNCGYTFLIAARIPGILDPGTS